ncbi:hypothetical protein FRC12_008547 [Ceratobasidium sp. 428]|nr:hypothetical protein FRC12_008547 [Ceratobasidium sp. 428]
MIANVELHTNRKELKRLKVDLKNALQREKRAKLKAQTLQESANTEHVNFLDALQRQKVAEAELNNAQVLADMHARDVKIAREYVNQLETQVTQYSEELGEAHNQLETQRSAVSSLTDHRLELHRARDALRKKVERLKAQRAKVEWTINPSNSLITPYQLKDKSGIIQPAA